MKIREIFEAVAGVPGKLEKEAILKENSSTLLQQILDDTYNTSRKYNIKKYEVMDITEEYSIEKNYDVFHELLDDLANRTLTGNAARMAASTVIGKFEKEDRQWLMRILDKNLKIGAGNTFAEDTGAIEKYPCALANVLEKAKNVDILDGNWMISRKLDGCRLHVHIDIDNHTMKFVSRQGKEFTTLSNLEEDIWKFMSYFNGGKWVLDGEVCIVDENGDENFRGLVALIKRKDYTIEHPVYKVFDILGEDDFWGRTTSLKFYDRYFNLRGLGAHMPADSKVQVLEQEWLDSQQTLDRWQAMQKSGNWEGLMVRRNVPYEGKRSNNLLKIKKFQDAEYVVTGIIEGDLTYNTTNGSETIHGVSALTIEHKGNQVKVGTGISKEQRLRWIWHPEEIIGKTITVKYFEESQDAKTGEYSLRFPTLVCVYDGERDI